MLKEAGITSKMGGVSGGWIAENPSGGILREGSAGMLLIIKQLSKAIELLSAQKEGDSASKQGYFSLTFGFFGQSRGLFRAQLQAVFAPAVEGGGLFLSRKARRALSKRGENSQQFSIKGS